MKELLMTEVSEQEIRQQIELAKQCITELGSNYPDDTFEDGVIATLEWIFSGAAAPLTEGSDND